jgi:hypothetical protein
MSTCSGNLNNRRQKKNESSAAWRKANQERVKENWKKWYSNNSDAVRDKAVSRYYLDHEKSKNKARIRQSTLYLEQKERVLKLNRSSRERDKKRTREIVFSHYGAKCVCCGESEERFLAIDHIGGGGAAHRRSLGLLGGFHFYKWIIKNDFPKFLRILCHNCNMATAYGKVCPHQEAKT